MRSKSSKKTTRAWRILAGMALGGLTSLGCAEQTMDARAPAPAKPLPGEAAGDSTAPSTTLPAVAGVAQGRVVSEHYVAASGGQTELAVSSGRIAARLGGRVIVWDGKQQPLAAAETFISDVYLALRHDGQALAVAGRIGPDMVLDIPSGEQLFVPFERRWKYDTGLEQFAPSGLGETPWLGIDQYDVVLLDPQLVRREQLPRSKAQQAMIAFEKQVSKLDYMDPRQGDRGAIWRLTLTANQRFAVALAKNQGQRTRLVRWDVPARKRLLDVPVPANLDTSTFAVSSAGAFAVVSGWSGSHNHPRLYRVELEPSSVRGRAIDLGPGLYSPHLSLTPDDQLLLAVRYDKSAWWSMETNQRVERGDLPGGAWSAGITPDHVVVQRSGRVNLLDRRTLKKVGALGKPGRAIRSVHELDDGRIVLVSGSDDHSVYRWSAEHPERLETMGRAPYHFGIRSGELVGLHGNGPCAQVEPIRSQKPTPGAVPLWKVCTQDHLWVERFGREPRVADVDFERDRLVLEDGPAFVVDGKTGQRTELARSGAYESLRGAWFSPRGRYVIAVGVPKSLVPERVLVWDAATGKLLHRLRVNEDFAGIQAVSGDEQRLAAAWGKELHLYDLLTGKKIKSAKLPSFAQSLYRDERHDWFIVRTRVGRRIFDADLNAVHRWAGWRTQRIEDGARAVFLASDNRRLATLELTADGHVIYTPSGSYAFSGSSPSHLHWVDREKGTATGLTRIPGKHDVAAVRHALRDASSR